MSVVADALERALRAKPVCLRCGEPLGELDLMAGRHPLGLCHACRRGIRMKARSPRKRAPFRLRDLWARARGLCSLCGWPVALEHASRDHVIPLADGGRNTRANVRLAHRWCNSAKGSGSDAPLQQDAWLSVARAIRWRDRLTWFEPVPEEIIREARRLVDRGFRIKCRVPSEAGTTRSGEASIAPPGPGSLIGADQGRSAAR